MSVFNDLVVEHPFGLRPNRNGEQRLYPMGWIAEEPWVSLDGAEAGFVDADDLAEILWQGSSGDTWDGWEAAVCRLKDGRYVAWETMYGPTGSGFSADAYGGEAQVFFANDLSLLVRRALGDAARRELEVPEHLWKEDA